jgi:group I intron endonuclease
MLIYQITNVANGKVYVGQTTMDLAHRWDCHVAAARRGSTPLARAIRKHGREGFRVGPIVHLTTESDLDGAEQFWIEQHRCLSPRGYNLTVGGQKSGGKQSQDVCDRKAASQRRRYELPLERARQGAMAREFWKRPEVRAKHAASLAASWTPERRAELSAIRAAMGNTRTPEGIERTAQSRRIAIIAIAPDGTETAYRSMTEAARATGTDLSAVSMCVNGKRRNASGFTFKKG